MMRQILAAAVAKIHPSSVGSLVAFTAICALFGVHELDKSWMTVAIALLVPGFTTKET